MAARSQEALYRRIDLDLSWSENALPQLERTKHVHGLHPYLGKFIPQLVEAFLVRYFQPGDCVYDPFAGSGTTLVEANAFGADAVGCEISAFNCLLCEVKTDVYSIAALERDLGDALERGSRTDTARLDGAGEWLLSWYAPDALGRLLAYNSALEGLPHTSSQAGQVILSRAARSARLTTHFELDSPRSPQREPYWCHKHRRTCRPVEESMKFLRRYTADTVRRLGEFAGVQTSARVAVVHGDARAVELPLAPTGVITSPPYPGLIDYHEQHRYAYELLGLRDRRDEELGAAAGGVSRAALRRYVDAVVAVFQNARAQLPRHAPVIIVVHDSKGLYPVILERSDLRLEQRVTRHVNRRTGRRAGEFFEDVLVCSTR